MAGTPTHLGQPDSSRRLVRSPRREDPPPPGGVDRLDPLVSSSPRLTLHRHRDSRSCQATMLQSQKMIATGIFRRNCQSRRALRTIYCASAHKVSSERPRVPRALAGWPGQLLGPSNNSHEVKNPFDLPITRSLDPVVDREHLVQRPPELRLVEPPPLRLVLAAPPPPVRLPPDAIPAAVEERLGFFG